MLVFFSALLLCVVFILVLRKCSAKVGLVDIPGGRKQHAVPTPTVGGLAMFVAVMLALPLGGDYADETKLLIGCAAMLVVLGVLDDRHDLRVGVRMMIQVFLVLMVILGAEGTITHLGALFGGVDIELGLIAIPFSVVAFVGGINAMNMIDGVDGMAGKMAFITTLGAAAIFSLSGNEQLLPLTHAMVGALVGFLFFNSRLFVQRAWVFMGDAGSMWIGLVLGWFMSQITTGKVAAEPALVLWLFGIPLIDTLVVMIRRVKRKRSPFDADRTHIHHVFKDRGASTRRTVLLMSLVQLTLVGIGVLFYIYQVPSWIVFWSFILLLVGYYIRFRDV